MFHTLNRWEPRHGKALSMIMGMAHEACGTERRDLSPSTSRKVWHFTLGCTSLLSDLTSSQRDR